MIATMTAVGSVRALKVNCQNPSLTPGTALEDFTKVVLYALPAISPFCF
jgi:hypothetical protein